MNTIRELAPDDRDTLLALAVASGLFDEAGVREIDARFAAHADGDEAIWLLSSREGVPSGVLYAIPEPMTDRTWNVLMLVVAREAHGQGHGQALMAEVETLLAARGQRLLIVETSSHEALERARGFYPRCGYAEAARIADFYAAGDDKVVFTKTIRAGR